MELTVAGGYFIPGKTPQVINKVNDLIALGYVPYGTPTYNEASGWISQLMVLDYGGSATDYTLTTGYRDKTPYFPNKPPVNGNWVLLGSLLARSNNFYVHAWLDGVAAGPAIDLANTTGTLPINRGGTGATTELDARDNLELGAEDDVTFNSVTTRGRGDGDAAYVANGYDWTPAASFVTRMFDATGTTLLAQGEFRADNNGNLSIINRDPTGTNAPQFFTFGQDGYARFPTLELNATVGKPLRISSGTPFINFVETDSSNKQYWFGADGGGLRINEDNTSGSIVWSYSSATHRLQLPNIEGNVQMYNGSTVSLGVITTGGGATLVGTRNQFEVTTAASFYLVRRNTANTTGQYVINFPTSAGTLALTGTSGANFKHDITDADLMEAVGRIDALRMVNFVYNDDEQNRQRFGIIAEEAEIKAPQYIKHREEMYECDIDESGSSINQKFRDRPFVDVNPIVMDLLGYVKHLAARVAELEAKLK